MKYILFLLLFVSCESDYVKKKRVCQAACNCYTVYFTDGTHKEIADYYFKNTYLIETIYCRSRGDAVYSTNNINRIETNF